MKCRKKYSQIRVQILQVKCLNMQIIQDRKNADNRLLSAKQWSIKTLTSNDGEVSQILHKRRSN